MHKHGEHSMVPGLARSSIDTPVARLVRHWTPAAAGLTGSADAGLPLHAAGLNRRRACWR